MRIQCKVWRNQKPSLSYWKKTIYVQKSTFQLILNTNLQLKAFKIQLVKQFKESDYKNRLTFTNEMFH